MFSKVVDKVSKFVNLYSSMLVHRDKDLYVFGAWYGDKFADNPKYLFMEYLKQGKKAVWVTKDTDVYRSMKHEHLPVCMAGTKKSIHYARKAGYVFFCSSLYDVETFHIGGAVLVNLWHGIPLKKIMYDDTYNYNIKKGLVSKLIELLVKIPYRNEYVVSTSNTITDIYLHAFRKKRDRILQLGQPRNDCFYDGSLKKKTYGDIPYQKLILYMPTHRNMGRSKMNVSKILPLDEIEDYCIKNDALFLIKKHYCHKEEVSDLDKYSHITDYTQMSVDTQELLYNADLLITDYSSCYIDYLLLNRPVVFYNYDFENYLLNDREMYFPYDDVTPGPKAHDFEELMSSIRICMDSENPYKESLEEIRDLFYDPENQKAVSRKILEVVSNI